MKAVLEINLNELNSNFLEIILSMFKKNVTEIILKPQTLTLDEFDKSLSLNDVMGSLKKSGHNAELLSEIKDGLKDLSIYNKHES